VAESRGRLGVLEADETNEEEVLGRVKSVIADEDAAYRVRFVDEVNRSALR